MPIVTAAIAVRVDDDTTYDDAVRLVEVTLENALDGSAGASLMSFCNHPDPDVLFHEDGPCPPLDQSDLVDEDDLPDLDDLDEASRLDAIQNDNNNSGEEDEGG